MRARTKWVVSILTAGALLGTGLAANGSAEPGTVHSMSPATLADGSFANLDACPALAEGYHGDCVEQLQTELNNDDRAFLAVDGTFGAATLRAVIGFQQHHGVTPADGIVGPATKAALDRTGPVATPQSAGTPHYPGSFDPVRAASWAVANAGTEASISADPCTDFVSRALSAAGMPDDAQWYRDSDAAERYVNSGDISGPWWGATSFVQLMESRHWIQVIPLNLADPLSAGQAISANGAIPNPGDLIYYEWNGVPSVNHVHLAMITGFDGRIALVTQQSGSGRYGAGTQWNLSYLSGGIPLRQKYGTAARAYLLHWQ
jgi:peptidoglycan hydrolase-like protein with peptidoglycan-binding domain